MDLSIRKFEFKDVSNKVKWINDPHNNKYLHYDLPLKQDKTEQWFKNNEDNKNRYDGVIEVDNKPIGIIGLINIDYTKSQAEYYITIGENEYHGKNIAFKASELLLQYAFEEIKLNKVYLYTEQENTGMQKLANRLGMLEEALLLNHSMRENNLYNTYYYSINKSDFGRNIKYPKTIMSDIDYLETDNYHNNIYMKRDDLISFSFGGNKARKAKYFFEKILVGDFETVITYGSKFSNHCRIIASMCKKYNLKCVIISPYGSDDINFNRRLIKMNDAEIIECEVEEVSDTIDQVLKHEDKKTDNKGYFIPGGGHGNLGTQAYVDAYHEIEIWSRQNNRKFDYIFLASGTGTTQAGLVLGNYIHKNHTEIIGISVARERDYGTSVIDESISDYALSKNIDIDDIDQEINFYDDLVISDYGKSTEEIDDTLLGMYENHGIAFNRSYTGKAFTGMKNYIKKNNLSNKNILFINTGGIPLFFDDLKNIERDVEY